MKATLTTQRNPKTYQNKRRHLRYDVLASTHESPCYDPIQERTGGLAKQWISVVQFSTLVQNHQSALWSLLIPFLFSSIFLFDFSGFCFFFIVICHPWANYIHTNTYICESEQTIHTYTYICESEPTVHSHTSDLDMRLSIVYLSIIYLSTIIYYIPTYLLSSIFYLSIYHLLYTYPSFFHLYLSIYLFVFGHLTKICLIWGSLIHLQIRFRFLKKPSLNLIPRIQWRNCLLNMINYQIWEHRWKTCASFTFWV